MIIEAVFFDGDQTLWDFESIMREAMAATLGELARRVPDLEPAQLGVDDAIADRDRVADELAREVIDLRVIRERGFERTLQRLGVEQAGDRSLQDRERGLARELTEHYMRLRHAATEPFGDAAAALPALARQHRLGLLTNGNSDPARFGLDRCLQWTFTAVDLGVAKPDPEIYRRAAERAGVDPARTVMVGDSLANDVDAAEAAGWRAVWVDRTRTAVGPGQRDRDVVVIATLTELGPALQRLSDDLG